MTDVRRALDFIGEATLGYTKQTDDVNSIELTPRIGARFHLFSRDLPTASGVRLIERPPTRPVVIRDLVRGPAASAAHGPMTGILYDDADVLGFGVERRLGGEDLCISVCTCG